MADDSNVRHHVEQLRQSLDQISMFSEGRHKVIITSMHAILDDLIHETDPKVYEFSRSEFLNASDNWTEADEYAQNEAREDGIADHQRS